MAAGGGREAAVRALNVDLIIGMGHHGVPETMRKLIRLLEPVKTLGAHRRGLGAGPGVVLRAAARLWACGLSELIKGAQREHCTRVQFGGRCRRPVTARRRPLNTQGLAIRPHSCASERGPATGDAKMGLSEQKPYEASEKTHLGG